MGRFADHLANHQPEWVEHHLDGVRISQLMESSTPGASRLDDTRFAWVSPTVLRLVVCDPAMCLIDPLVIAREAGQRALRIIMASTDLVEGLRAANEVLYRPGASRSTQMSLACIAAVDWHVETGEMHAARAGDCQVLVSVNGQWIDVFPNEILTPEAVSAWKGAAPQRDRPAHLADHDRILGHPGAWLTCPLGQFSEPLLEHATHTGVVGVAISSDGIRLNEHAVTNLQEVWAGLHNRPDDWPHNQPHGDIAVLTAARN
jgi:hypothetical protein